MGEVLIDVIRFVMVMTGLLFVVAIYRKAPSMWDRYLDAKERVARIHLEEKDRERQHAKELAADDYKARHNDRNILMVGQSELIAQVVESHKESLKIICDNLCKYRYPSEPEPRVEEPPNASIG